MTEPDFPVAFTKSWMLEKHPPVPPGLTQRLAGLADADTAASIVNTEEGDR